MIRLFFRSPGLGAKSRRCWPQNSPGGPGPRPPCSSSPVEVKVPPALRVPAAHPDPPAPPAPAATSGPTAPPDLRGPTGPHRRGWRDGIERASRTHRAHGRSRACGAHGTDGTDRPRSPRRAGDRAVLGRLWALAGRVGRRVVAVGGVDPGGAQPPPRPIRPGLPAGWLKTRTSSFWSAPWPIR
jgi:hypothetical protein